MEIEMQSWMHNKANMDMWVRFSPEITKVSFFTFLQYFRLDFKYDILRPSSSQPLGNKAYPQSQNRLTFGEKKITLKSEQINKQKKH